MAATVLVRDEGEPEDGQTQFELDGKEDIKREDE